MPPADLIDKTNLRICRLDESRQGNRLIKIDAELGAGFYFGVGAFCKSVAEKARTCADIISDLDQGLAAA